jgi:tRNA pseudouridine32 synthase/23S rRNA pseudouridine746 synthase
MLRESQWMKAELRRKRQYHNQRIAQQESVVEEKEAYIRQLKEERKKRSDMLQQWLFRHFVMRNAKGEKRNLIDIFADTTTPIPPSGSGECCAPKLLQHAFIHHLNPLCIAEFWWGESPKGEIRKHRNFYPACRGKCLPILKFMLQGLNVEENIHAKAMDAQPEIIYEDEWLMVIDKPAGMLSVPGKQDTTSVYDFARNHCPEATGPLVVHRLDMDTSGILLLAKSKHIHQDLQAQFHHRTIKKTYVARLANEWPAHKPHQGVISLPLRPNPLDRPRQIVDPIHGKTAITTYESVGCRDIVMHPKTGRTHQLRVHCAHPEGLDNPILGDPLYGTPDKRLYLHASEITFVHPITRQQLTFHSPCPW